VGASEPAVAELAPLGRTLPVAEMLALGDGREVTASDEVPLGGRDAVVGYRAAIGPAGTRVVLAAPAAADDYALDQRRRDLGFLVLLAAVVGGLASLWLSGLAARQLSRPVGALRRAALAIGEGDADPRQLAAALDDTPRPPGRGLAWLRGGWRFTDPPAEFRPVFGAFRQMAADLAVSRDALEVARRRTAAVLRDVASGVLAVDADARVTIANPRVEALLGRRMPAGSALDGRGPALLAARVRAFVWRGGPATDEDAFDVEVGGRQLRARLTRLGGADGGAVLTLDDVTELARAERVLAWGEMARQVAHEIKNPLTPIRLGVQLLRRAHRDGRANFGTMLETTVERVLAEIDRLDEIARSFSKYGTAPDRQPPAEVVDAAAVARDVVALERLGQGAVEWALEGADVPVAAMARDGELREVLINLLENARLAHARRVTLRVAREDGHVALAVADDGEGIPPDVLPRIFEPRFSTRTSGSGLGLAISRRLVEAWGGDVRADSRQSPGASGTTVTLRLRVPAGAPDAALGTAGGPLRRATPGPTDGPTAS
jgi:nitrogen fixation/metabolism regulation signal transduction histidine kinase